MGVLNWSQIWYSVAEFPFGSHDEALLPSIILPGSKEPAPQHELIKQSDTMIYPLIVSQYQLLGSTDVAVAGYRLPQHMPVSHTPSVPVSETLLLLLSWNSILQAEAPVASSQGRIFDIAFTYNLSKKITAHSKQFDACTKKLTLHTANAIVWSCDAQSTSWSACKNRTSK